MRNRPGSRDPQVPCARQPVPIERALRSHADLAGDKARPRGAGMRSRERFTDVGRPSRLAFGARWLVALSFALAARSASPAWTSVDAGRGPVPVQVPDAPAPPAGYPLIVLLHGFGVTGVFEELYLQMSVPVSASGFLYALPDGTLNPNGERFWNATDACCDTFGSGVDDVGYLLDLLDAIDTLLGVDARRVFFLGHSNGAFMAYRMACSAADRVTGSVSLAGATYYDPADCQPARPVGILHIHGTADARILYAGGELLAPYPGAEQSVAAWASYDGCSEPPASGAPFDAEATLPGDETAVSTYAIGCRGPRVELWTILGGEHIPTFTATFRERLMGWFEDASSALFADGFESGDLRAWGN